MEALNTYSVKQLKNIVVTHNASEKANIIKSYGKMKKPELVKAISKQIKQEHLMKILDALKLSTIVSGETIKIKVKKQPNKMETKLVEEMLMMMEEGGSKVAKKIRESGMVDEMTAKQEEKMVEDFMKMMESQGSKMTEKVKKSIGVKPRTGSKEEKMADLFKEFDVRETILTYMRLYDGLTSIDAQEPTINKKTQANVDVVRDFVSEIQNYLTGIGEKYKVKGINQDKMLDEAMNDFMDYDTSQIANIFGEFGFDFNYDEEDGTSVTTESMSDTNDFKKLFKKNIGIPKAIVETYKTYKPASGIEIANLIRQIMNIDKIQDI